MPSLIRNLDFVNIMAYDYHGGWEMNVNYLVPWRDAQVGGEVN